LIIDEVKIQRKLKNTKGIV